MEYTLEELSQALQVVSSTISKCEKMQPKFTEGTTHYSLLRNRIKAMYISRSLITNENTVDQYTIAELGEALTPVASIISKCEKAQRKFIDGTSNHTKFRNIIKSMQISKSLITEAVNNRSNCVFAGEDRENRRLDSNTHN